MVFTGFPPSGLSSAPGLPGSGAACSTFLDVFVWLGLSVTARSDVTDACEVGGRGVSDDGDRPPPVDEYSLRQVGWRRERCRGVVEIEVTLEARREGGESGWQEYASEEGVR